jgi:voltage-gated potassium channel
MSPRSPKQIGTAGRRVKAAVPSSPIERRMNRFLREPPSVRAAAGVIVTATATVVVVSGIAMRLIDPEQYKNIWVGMWWAIQTVTTVGYGDVTPSKPGGRLLAAFVMLEGIAFLAVITAAITSSFVARAEKERQLADDAAEEVEIERLERRFDGVDQRLERIEAALESLRGSH